MAVNADGSYTPDQQGVAERVAAITSGNSPLMQQARTAGLESANRRGLGNSSIATQASEAAVLGAATPIASQDASQVAQQNLAYQNNTAQRGITNAQLAEDQQKNLAAQFAEINGQRNSALAATLQNDKIPAADRAAVQGSIGSQWQQTADALQNIYGLSAFPATKAPTPAAAPTGTQSFDPTQYSRSALNGAL